MKAPSLKSNCLKLILGGCMALFLNSPPVLVSTVSAQTDPHSFPGDLIVEGVWSTIGAGHELISMDNNLILDWEATSGRYRFWFYDPSITGNNDPFHKTPIVPGTLTAFPPEQRVTYLGNFYVLNWDPSSGQYRIQQYVPTITGNVNALVAQSTADNRLSNIDSDHQLIHLDNNKILDWEPVSGQYRIWQFYPTLSGKITPVAQAPIVEGTWDTIQTGHKLIYLGNHRLLDWQPITGQYRIWRYDPMVKGQANPLVGDPVAEGIWQTIQADHELVYLGNNRLLDWQPATGQYRIWEYDLTAVAIYSVDEVAARLNNQTVTGVTIITHGFQLWNDGGDSLEELAEAIHTRTGGWLLDYDVTSDFDNGDFDMCENCTLPDIGTSETGEVVLLFDWAPESNELADGWGESAGDALFNLLIYLGLIDPLNPSNNVPLHFIGHSFGTAVTSEAIERLAQLDILVDHVTYLDPHDFDQALLPVDENQKLFELGQPEGYGVSVWSNIAFADVYYETRGSNEGAVLDENTELAYIALGIVNPVASLLVPEGRPILGAHNRLLDDELPALTPPPYNGIDDLGGDHSYVWNCFYLATVTKSLPQGCTIPQTPIDFAHTGYAFSRIAGGISDRPQPIFGGADQDHKHTKPDLIEEDFPEDGWPSKWNSLIITNGNFERYNMVFEVCRVTNTCPQPGWSHHGGGGKGHFDKNTDENNAYLVLDGGPPGLTNEIHTHNRFYIPPDATYLQFDLQRHFVTNADDFRVKLGNQVLKLYELNGNDPFFITQVIAIPVDFRGRVTTLTFEIPDSFIGSEALLDNIVLIGPGLPYSVYLPSILRDGSTPVLFLQNK